LAAVKMTSLGDEIPRVMFRPIPPQSL
jgi:hypothetical protein